VGAGDAPDAAGDERIVEGFAEQRLADVGLGFVARAEVVDAQAIGRLFAGEVGADWRRRACVGIDGDGGRLGKSLGRTFASMFGHQAL
jgi:hypothetical protein